METGGFYPIKPCLSIPRDGDCRTSPQGSSPTLATFKEIFYFLRLAGISRALSCPTPGGVWLFHLLQGRAAQIPLPGPCLAFPAPSRTCSILPNIAPWFFIPQAMPQPSPWRALARLWCCPSCSAACARVSASASARATPLLAAQRRPGPGFGVGIGQ